MALSSQNGRYVIFGRTGLSFRLDSRRLDQQPVRRDLVLDMRIKLLRCHGHWSDTKDCELFLYARCLDSLNRIIVQSVDEVWGRLGRGEKAEPEGVIGISKSGFR